MPPELDIVIPVYNEGRNIVATLASLARAVTTPTRVLICYDRPDDDTALPKESLEDVGQEILEVRRQHEVAACKYCGISTLDAGEMALDSRMIALLRVAGLGVNSATFSEFNQRERICSDCAGHEVECELCGRMLDAFLDEGEYRRAKDDEAYVCSTCRGRLEDQLHADRDW